MRQEDTAVFVVFFEDMKGSMVLKERMAEKWDEEAFQDLRREHDALIAEIITQTVRIPDAILRVRAHENDSLVHALNSVANQWDSLFS